MLALRGDVPVALKARKLETALARIDRVAAVDGAQGATARGEMLGLQTTGSRVEVEIESTAPLGPATRSRRPMSGRRSEPW
jgi:hypothetical protein